MPNPFFFQLKSSVLGGYNKFNKKQSWEKTKKEEVNMFFKSKKKELLYRENICVNCKEKDKEQVIRKVGQMLVDSGYVEQSYVEAMLEREKSFSTFMGNGLALPHGVEAAKKAIKASGIAVMTFPEGIDWDGNNVNVVIGVAGVGEEHLKILSVIAEKMLDETVAAKLVAGDAETVYEILSEKK